MNTARIDSLISRVTAFGLAAIVTAAALGAIDTLARRDVSADALLAHKAPAAQTAQRAS